MITRRSPKINWHQVMFCFGLGGHFAMISSSRLLSIAPQKLYLLTEYEGPTRGKGQQGVYWQPSIDILQRNPCLVYGVTSECPVPFSFWLLLTYPWTLFPLTLFGKTCSSFRVTFSVVQYSVSLLFILLSLKFRQASDWKIYV